MQAHTLLGRCLARRSTGCITPPPPRPCTSCAQYYPSASAMHTRTHPRAPLTGTGARAPQLASMRVRARPCMLPQAHAHANATSALHGAPLSTQRLVPHVTPPALLLASTCSPCCPSTTTPQQQHGARRARHSVVPHAAAPVAAPAAAAAVVTPAVVSAPGGNEFFAVLLGNAMLLGSCFRSVPQIVKVLKSGSAEGLSLTSNAVELVCLTVMMAYNLQQGYAFNTYGEVAACWIQDVIIVALILKHLRTSTALTLGSCILFAGLCGLLFWPGLVPGAVLHALQAWNLAFLALGSKVPQIWLNWRRGNAGMLSLTTCVLNVAGNLVRTYTTLVLTQDTLLLLGNASQGVLNFILLLQALQTEMQQRAAAKGGQLATDGA